MSVPDPDRRVEIGHCRRTCEARVDHDQLGLVMGLRLGHPLESAGVRLGRVAPHDQNYVRILDVNPVVGHRTTAKRRGQTGHRRAVSDTGLIIEYEHPQAANRLVRDVAGFVRRGRGSEHSCRQPAIDRSHQRFGQRNLHRDQPSSALRSWSNASSHEMRFHSFDPAARCSGYLSRLGL